MKTRITVVSFLTIIFLGSLISLSFYINFRSVIQDSLLSQQFTLVSETADQMNGRIQLAQHQLLHLSEEISNAGIQAPGNALRNVTAGENNRIIFDAGLALITPDGRLAAEEMNLPHAVGQDISFRDFVKIPLSTGKSYVSAPFRLKIPPHTPTIAIVEPVKGKDGRILALLAGFHTLGQGHFLTSLPAPRTGSSGYLYILHGRTLLMHPDSRRILEVVGKGVNAGIDKSVNGFEGSVELYTSQGRHMLSSFKKIGDSGWVLVSNTPYDEVFSPLGKLAKTALLIFAMGIILASVVIWYFSRYVTRPIQQLISHVDGVNRSGGDWSPVELRTGDELEQLARAFNSMMEEVRDANRKLNDDKQYMESLINSAAIPIFVIDNSHKVLYWNRALELLTGIAATDVKGTDKQWTGFYPEKHNTLVDIAVDGVPDTVDNYLDLALLQVLPNALRSEGWLELKGGRRYMIFEAAPIRDGNGDVIAFMETGLDITDRILLEEKLGQLTRAVEQSPASIVITDIHGNIEYVNPKFCKNSGYSFEEAIGQNPRILKSGEWSDSRYSDLWNTITSGKEWRGEFHNRRKDGTLYWEFASISPLFDKHGVINGFLAVKEDITARKAVEEELKASRMELVAKHEQMREIFQQVEQAKSEWEQTLDHLRDLVLLTDAGNGIRRANRMLSDITGRKMDELIGSDWRETLAGAGFLFQSFNGRTGQLTHTRSARTYDLTVYDINIDGRIDGYVVSLNDTTELHEATSELEEAYQGLKAAQMQIFQQEKMASIGQLAAGVAHEINNPMGFISSNLGTLNKYFERVSEYLGSTDQVLSGCADKESAVRLSDLRKRLKIDHIMDDARQLILESQDGAGRVKRIVHDLKSFSRVDQTECTLMNLNEAMETTINIAWNEIKYVATLNREFGDIPRVKCYPQQLNQVFLNLLVNAAHAIGSNSGVIQVRTWSDDRDVYVSVSDNGCGIPENALQRIFDPFYTTKEVGKGTGLGLSISYDIIKKHNGEIKVDSQVGRGTTFTVRLPIDGPEDMGQ